ncbi:FecR family protein [Sphingomonas tabacisoli]|uniref:FecR family protein n=1 Tax=Sphingomonas tabacisoli TaxID=2249466 RepID=A0ABW4I399_9SPHN
MTDERIIDEAIAWHQALNSDDADWDGFTQWLEADSAHREAFDSIALLDDRITAHREALAVILPAEDIRAPRRRWWAWGGAGAAIAAAAAAILMVPAEAPDQIFSTRYGESRTVALKDGSSIQLASASKLQVSDGGKQLALDGTASFDVPHRRDRTLTVQAGDLSIQDIGTRFEVVTGTGVARVSVAEGAVSVSAPTLDHPVRLTSGNKLLYDPAHDVAEMAPIQEFASWKKGRLVYDNAPLALVAAEVGRYARREVVLDRALADRRFSGVLKIGDGSGLVGDLARLMDVDVHSQGTALRLVDRNSDR